MSKRKDRRQSVEQIAKRDGVTAAEVEAGIAEVEGLFAMVAGVSEVPDDASPRITVCPLCGGQVGFYPITLSVDIPRLAFDSTTWGGVRKEFKDYVLSAYENDAQARCAELPASQRMYIERVIAEPVGVMLECRQCGKGFNPIR